MAYQKNTTCYRCGKLIRRTELATFTSPSILLQRLGMDFSKVYHPACYEAAEREAARELKGVQA